jgi:hypothetical protein
MAVPLTRVVTPAKAGAYHRRMKLERREMDSRLRGNDEGLTIGE